MKKYLVKLTSVATENNVNFKGQVAVFYYGKDQKIISTEGSSTELVYTNAKASKYMIKEYGYNRLCDAKRSWIYKNAVTLNRENFWKMSAEIVEVEV